MNEKNLFFSDGSKKCDDLQCNVLAHFSNNPMIKNSCCGSATQLMLFTTFSTQSTHSFASFCQMQNTKIDFEYTLKCAGLHVFLLKDCDALKENN